MLTQEQINKLKPYDTLILNNYPISYLGTYTSGIIGALDDKAEACCYTRCHFPQQYLSLPPKHDPTRLYKVHAIFGDNGTPSFFAVRKGDVTVAAFFCDTPRAFTEEQALAAAEAECARLNEEYRKEQK